ncbi:MAG: 2-hydroxyacyl-CoA dehydratase [Deltaproteobacteria bacterium]|jgi:benzoyl-CoA reductase/2-hydroxyglutaryl-CoA dehydratase subunit BcrC/BadD/HgdB|nr:2-hydroxyacyl-CoA dehydratase [Deltaproteobacteria bacterium]MBW2533631.1 2-hydroxyacyl-CoA dehydratase [Deltaproteobacteria bacterium]
MSLWSSAQYHVNVTALSALIRASRLKSEWTLRRRGDRGGEHTGPILGTSPRLKELIARHYLRGRYANLRGPVAWVTSGAPVEFLVALGYYVLYPENHGAVCGIRRTAERLCGHAEEAGWSRDICSYARTDFGSVLSGETPVGRLPKPDLLVCCTNICQTVLYWYRVLADHFGCPMVVIDTPFIYDEADDHALHFVERQIEAATLQAERVAGRTLVPADLERTMRYAQQATELWMQIMDRGKARPAPLTAFDEFIHMAPIVEMRGEDYTVDYYGALLAELDDRIARGIGAVKNEKKRLIWDNLPIWYRVRWLSEMLAQRGVALVASTYTNAWGELAHLFDPADPIRSGARTYMHAILNRSTGHKLRTMGKLCDEYQADGVLLHSDRSCKPYSIGQVDQTERLLAEMGRPALLLDADHNDPRVFSEEQATARLEAFFEVLGV